MKKPSVWYWVICIVLFLWSLMGVVDFVMTQTHNEAYLASYPQEMLDYWFAFPFWVNLAWGVAVFGGLFGWGLMLLRRSWAVPLFILSLLGMIVTNIYYFTTGGFAMQAEHGGIVAQIFTVVIILLSIFAIWYSRRARANGILK